MHCHVDVGTPRGDAAVSATGALVDAPAAPLRVARRTWSAFTPCSSSPSSYLMSYAPSSASERDAPDPHRTGERCHQAIKCAVSSGNQVCGVIRQSSVRCHQAIRTHQGA